MGRDLDVLGLTVAVRSSGVELLHIKHLFARHSRTTAVIGASGAGKSLLGHALARALPESLDACTSVDGHRLYSTQGSADWRRAVGRVVISPQLAQSSLPPLATPLSLVAKVLTWNNPAMSKPLAHTKAETLLTQVGFPTLDGARHLRCVQLSGGMARRTVLAAATAAGADWLYLDEPTVGLDPPAIEELIDFLLSTAREGQLALLIASHDLRFLSRVAQSHVALRNGRLMSQGDLPASTDAAFNNLMEAALLAAGPDGGTSHHGI
jgi:ABC-type glutathione transport system ATPase component